MRDPDHALRLIEATVATTSLPVTLKMRLGWDHASLNAPEIAKRAEDAGVRMLTIHGRTRQQFFQLHFLDADLHRAFRAQKRIVGDHFHLQPKRAIGDDSADIAAADEP